MQCIFMSGIVDHQLPNIRHLLTSKLTWAKNSDKCTDHQHLNPELTKEANTSRNLAIQDKKREKKRKEHA